MSYKIGLWQAPAVLQWTESTRLRVRRMAVVIADLKGIKMIGLELVITNFIQNLRTVEILHAKHARSFRIRIWIIGKLFVVRKLNVAHLPSMPRWSPLCLMLYGGPYLFPKINSSLGTCHSCNSPRFCTFSLLLSPGSCNRLVIRQDNAALLYQHSTISTGRREG